MTVLSKLVHTFYGRKDQSFAVESELKYLFNVTYLDGSKFFQNPQDISKQDPKRSAFYDVNVEEVEEFKLDSSENDDGPGINLKTGRFFFEGPETFVEFYVGDPGPKPYKLIFYRQHTHNFNVGSMEELSHEVKYCIGYTDADGKDHTILVD